MQVRNNVHIHRFIRRMINVKVEKSRRNDLADDSLIGDDNIIQFCLEKERKNIILANKTFEKTLNSSFNFSSFLEIASSLCDSEDKKILKKLLVDLLSLKSTKIKKITELLDTTNIDSNIQNQIIEWFIQKNQHQKKINSTYPVVDRIVGDYNSLYDFIERTYNKKTLIVFGGTDIVISDKFIEAYCQQIDCMNNLFNLNGNIIEFDENDLEFNDDGVGVSGDERPQSIDFKTGRLKNTILTRVKKTKTMQLASQLVQPTLVENINFDDINTAIDNIKINNIQRESEAQKSKIENEIRIIILCQKIKDEIARLESTRSTWNPFVNATETKINILSRLLQLITAPESFSLENRNKYFQGNTSANLYNIIQTLLTDTQFRNADDWTSISNEDLLNKPDVYLGNVSTTMNFIKEIQSDYGNLDVSISMPQKHRVLREDEKIEYDEVIVFSDSLSDIDLMRRGPFGAFCGLVGNSPYGSFTNGRSWLYHFCNDLYNKSVNYCTHPRDKLIRSDSGITLNINLKPTQNNTKKLYHESNDEEGNKFTATLEDINNCDVYKINDIGVVRSYAIGGATASNYKFKLSGNIVLDFTRLIVSRLSDQREQFLTEEKKNPSNPKRKLFVDWIGANDLITVNELPTLEEADNIIKAKIEHYEAMIRAGYTNFVVMNLPDLSYTPRYQRKNLKERNQAHLVSEYVNRQIEVQIKELKKLYPECNIDICDINSKFTAGIDALQKGGEEAKAYQKYIRTHYDFIDEHKSDQNNIQENQFKYSLVNRYGHHNNLDEEYIFKYKVIDICGQPREGEFPLRDLFDGNEEEAQQFFRNNGAINNKLRAAILNITNARGHTIAENDIYTPLKDTIAFQKYQEELKAKNQNIETTHLLPGVGRVFFDDVHPSADMHRFLFDEVNNFIEQKYHFNPVPPKQNNEKGVVKDDFDVGLKNKQLAKMEKRNNSDKSDEELIAQFLRKYLYQFNLERNSLFGWLRERKLEWDRSNIKLEEIFNHAFHPEDGSTGERTKGVMIDLGWIDNKGNILLEQMKDYHDKNNVKMDCFAKSGSQ